VEWPESSGWDEKKASQDIRTVAVSKLGKSQRRYACATPLLEVCVRYAGDCGRDHPVEKNNNDRMTQRQNVMLDSRSRQVKGTVDETVNIVYRCGTHK